MGKAEDLREKIQQKIVDVVSRKLESGQMTQERAKTIAQLVLEKLPEGISYEKLMQVLPTLDDHFEELSAAVLPIIQEYETKVKAEVDKKIKQLVKEGKLDELLELTNKAIEFESNLA